MEERRMRKYKLKAILGIGLAALVMAGCGSSKSSSTPSSTGGAASTTSSTAGGSKAEVAVLLPDTQSSVRWEQFDLPYLDKALTAGGVSHTTVTAQGDPSTRRTQAAQA